jgi:hypothetical protein
MTKIARMTPTIPRGAIIGKQMGGPPSEAATALPEVCGLLAKDNSVPRRQYVPSRAKREHPEKNEKRDLTSPQAPFGPSIPQDFS